MKFIPYKYDAFVAVICQLLSSNFFQHNFSEVFLTPVFFIHYVVAQCVVVLHRKCCEAPLRLCVQFLKRKCEIKI